MNIEDLAQEVEQIKSRNRRVEADKAWERSAVRRIFIAAATYIVAAVWLVLISDTEPFLKALVPVAGYLLSTLSLPVVKNIWIEKFLRK